MPDEPTPRRRQVPSARRFVAGALAGFVAIFGVLALRVHDGDDPALASVSTTKAKAKATSTTSTTTSDDGDSSASSAVTSTPGASTSAS